MLDYLFSHCDVWVSSLPPVPLEYIYLGNSLEVQWLGLRASTAGGMGSIPGQGTRISRGMAKKRKKNIFI